ncbi:MAG TPA: hypothetical protein VFX13_08365 [Gaiellales bacterium]|nr:hypothetical protein [Gaiellales bacterium]
MRFADYDLGIPFQPEATEFSDDIELSNPEIVIRKLREHPEFLRPLEEATYFDSREGRPRIEGSWALVMIGFVMSRYVDVHPFIVAQLRNASFWDACGFTVVPSYPTAHRRLTELEERADAFWAAAVPIIQQARKHEPRIGKVLHADGTPFRTNARLHHDCPDPVACRAARKKARAKIMPSLSYQEEKEHRQLWQDASLEEAEKLDEESLPEKTEEDPRVGGRYYWFRGHRYWSRDAQAGVRTYAKKRAPYSWQGGILNALTCAFTNATIVPKVIPADEGELGNYPELIDRLLEIMGEETPDVVSGDKALAFNRIFELNTKLGSETVAPKRVKKEGQSIADGYRETWVDEDNVLRCQHCGGPTTTNGPGLGPDTTRTAAPRLRYRCRLGLTPECRKRTPQYVDRSKSWLQATAINRTDALYHAVRSSHETLEKVHDDIRDRYAASGKTPPQTPKRPGIRWQELRVNAAFFIQWFRICLRHGWLGSWKRINTLPVQYRTARDRHLKTLNRRRRAGLDLPYGPIARALGLSPPEPIPPPIPAT